MMLDLTSPLVVVAHDAGGANQIIAMLLANGGANGIRAYMDGPALGLWKRAFPAHKLSMSLENALEGASSLLTGTGWAGDLEYSAIRLGRESGVRTVAVLDHWVNYPDRFVRDGNAVSPDAYWVVDEYAEEIARGYFPSEKVHLINNYYLRQQVSEIKFVADEQPTLLYVLEPMRNDWGRGLAGEFQALDYLLNNISKLHLPKNIRILLRPHPSEDREKYNDWIGTNLNIDIQLDDSSSIAAAVSYSKWVAGCESYALVVALAAGRTVFSTLPPWAPTCRLPHDGIIHIRKL